MTTQQVTECSECGWFDKDPTFFTEKEGSLYCSHCFPLNTCNACGERYSKAHADQNNDHSMEYCPIRAVYCGDCLVILEKCACQL